MLTISGPDLAEARNNVLKLALAYIVLFWIYTVIIFHSYQCGVRFVKNNVISTSLKTRLTYNCAHLRSTKESLTFEYLDISFLYHISIGCHWLIHDGTGSV